MTDATDVALEKACEAFRAVMFGSSPIAAGGFDPCIKAAIEAYQAALPKGELAEELERLCAQLAEANAKLAVAQGIVVDCAQFLDGVKPDAVKEGWWSEWDQQVRDRITQFHLDLPAQQK